MRSGHFVVMCCHFTTAGRSGNVLGMTVRKRTALTAGLLLLFAGGAATSSTACWPEGDCPDAYERSSCGCVEQGQAQYVCYPSGASYPPDAGSPADSAGSPDAADVDAQPGDAATDAGDAATDTASE